MPGEIKEVQMDTPFQEGGKKRRKTRTRKNKAYLTEATEAAIVTKESGPVDVSVPVPVAVAPSPKIVLAPPKKKPAKIMLVPKQPSTKEPVRKHRKTFKAKRIKVTIDNTATTRKHRSSIMEKVDALTDEQIRSAAVKAKLSRPNANAPIGLLRQMVKDYQSMKRMLL